MEFKSAPSLLDLSQTALDSATTQQVTVADIPAGTYQEIRFKIHKISQTEAGSDAALQAMAAQNASVIVDYTKAGTTQSATFVSSVDADQRLEGNFPLTDGSHALTLNVDASTWLNNPSGGCLNPANSNDRSGIENNIQKSLKAYKDDDHDGHEDR